MNNSSRFLLASVLVALLGCVSFTVDSLSVNAQTSAGVGIKPAVIEDRLEPGETKSFTIEVTNLSGIDQIFYLTRRDIIGVQDGGVPIFAPRDQEKTGFELSEWINLNAEELFIPAGQATTVDFTLIAPPDAIPGSHFGGIVVSVEPPDLGATGAAIGYEVANIVTVRISGEVNESARVRQFATEKYLHGSAVVDFDVKIENEGNTLVRPVGLVTVNNMLGSEVARLDFNDTGAGVFPGTTRDFSLNWQSDSPGFGRYEAVFTATYGDTGAMRTIDSTATFWIIPLGILLPALGVLLVLFAIVYFMIKLYVRRTVAILTAGSTRRIVRQRPASNFPVFLLIVSLLAVTALLLIILLALFA